MLAALLLAILGGGALLLYLGRASADESAERKLVEQLIDLAVRDPAAALRLLRDHPALRSARCVDDETPLHYCAVEGLAEGVRFLAGAGFPVDAPNRFGDTPLVDAVARGDLEMTKLLLRLGADPNAASRTRGSVLKMALATRRPKLVEALLDAGARGEDVGGQDGTAWDALARGDSTREEMERILERHGVRR